MITEIAYYTIKPGMEAEFEAAARKGVPLLRRAKGCKRLTLHRSIQKPQRYWLLIQWDTVEDHTVGFLNSEDFQVWRGHVSPYFDGRPEFEHTNDVALT